MSRFPGFFGVGIFKEDEPIAPWGWAHHVAGIIPAGADTVSFGDGKSQEEVP